MTGGAFRAVPQMGIRAVGIYAHEDRFAPHRFKSDESYVIGRGMEPIAAYLSIAEVETKDPLLEIETGQRNPSTPSTGSG